MLSIGSFGRREYDIVFKLPLYIHVCASTLILVVLAYQQIPLIHAYDGYRSDV